VCIYIYISNNNRSTWKKALNNRKIIGVEVCLFTRLNNETKREKRQRRRKRSMRRRRRGEEEEKHQPKVDISMLAHNS
jgi:hypothetical protein